MEKLWKKKKYIDICVLIYIVQPFYLSANCQTKNRVLGYDKHNDFRFTVVVSNTIHDNDITTATEFLVTLCLNHLCIMHNKELLKG